MTNRMLGLTYWYATRLTQTRFGREWCHPTWMDGIGQRLRDLPTGTRLVA